MGERSDQIAQDIEVTRERLGADIQELERKVKRATDWRTQFEEHPLAIAALAFAGGMLLARIIGGSTRAVNP